jgi:hypothetical protein
MSESTTTETAASSNAGDKESISAESWVFKREKELQARAKTPPSQVPATPKEEKQPEATPEVQEPSAKEQHEEPNASEGEDVLSKLGIDSQEKLDAVIEALTKQDGNKSRLLARLNELNADRKAQKTRAQELEEELKRIKSESPKPTEQNPYAKIKSASEIESLETQAAEALDWADDILAVNEMSGANDPVYDRQGNPVLVDGKPWTKIMVRDAMRNAKNALAKHLPAQRKAIEAESKRTELGKALMEQATKELPWLSQENDPVKAKYDALLKDVGIEAIENSVPDAAPRLRHALAHAANSLYAPKVVAGGVQGKTPSIKPPSNPGSGAAKSSSPEARMSASLKEALQRYQKSGSPEDYVTLRTLQQSRV